MNPENNEHGDKENVERIPEYTRSKQYQWEGNDNALAWIKYLKQIDNNTH